MTSDGKIGRLDLVWTHLASDPKTVEFFSQTEKAENTAPLSMVFHCAPQVSRRAAQQGSHQYVLPDH